MKTPPQGSCRIGVFPRIQLSLLAGVCLLGATSQAQTYINETFEDDTIGAVPSDPSQRSTNQVLTAAGTGLIGTDNVAHYNDASGTAAAALEYVVGASALSSMYFQFDLWNNQPSLAGGTLNVSVGPWNNATGSQLNANAACAFRLQFSQDLGTVNIRTNTGSFQSGGAAYNPAVVQTVKIWVNDDDSSTLSYLRPDTLAPALLGANSAVVWINDSLVGLQTDSGFVMNVTPLSIGNTTGNATIGRVGFNTTSGNVGNWLIDNVYVSAVPEPSSAALLVAGGLLLGWRSRRRSGGPRFQ